MVGSTAAAGGLNYGVGPSVMQIELARTKCSKCIIKFLCGRRSGLRWGISHFYFGGKTTRGIGEADTCGCGVDYPAIGPPSKDLGLLPRA